MKKLFTLLLSSLIYCSLHAAIINVPGDYPTIQEGILASFNGDTVLVEPGTYYENINFRGRQIVLTSRFYETGDTSYISSTIIDGSNPVHPDTASCIILNSGETSDAVIQGFTIRGGGGTVWYDIHGAGIYREGGAILTEFSSPIIQFNIIRDNNVVDEENIDGNGGGAIRSGDSYPTIQNNVIVNNHAIGYGGAIVLNYGGAKIRNNIIAYNSAGADYSGGGIWCTGANANTIVTIENNTIAYNTSNGSGGFAGKGGGIFVFSVHVNVHNNIIWGNHQTTGGPIGNNGGEVVVTYSDVEGGWASTGNIDADPLFTSCFVLSPTSPCVDTGDPSSAYEDPGSGSTAAYPSQGTLANDMGAYGGPMRTVLPCFEVTTGIAEQISTVDFTLQNFPNPFSSATTISFHLNNESDVVVEIISLTGNKLATLLNDHLQSGSYTIPFENGKQFQYLPGGIYLLKLTAGNATQLKKLVLAAN